MGMSKWTIFYSTLLSSFTYTSSWQFNIQFTEPNPFSQTSQPHFYKQGRNFQKKSLYNPQKVLDLKFSARNGQEETGFSKVLTVTTERIQSPCTKPGHTGLSLPAKSAHDKANGAHRIRGLPECLPSISYRFQRLKTQQSLKNHRAVSWSGVLGQHYINQFPQHLLCFLDTCCFPCIPSSWPHSPLSLLTCILFIFSAMPLARKVLSPMASQDTSCFPDGYITLLYTSHALVVHRVSRWI